MRKFSKYLYFGMIRMLTGVLFIGTPVLAGASEDIGVNQEMDHSMEGQIQKPKGERELVDDSTNNTYGFYTIMGNTTVTAEEMAEHFQAQNLEYPGTVLEQGGAATIQDFCTIILEEAEAEQVRGEVVFEQAMLETGWLQFSGVCKPEQYNFAGLGATGGDEPGNSFPDVRTGIRAQVQHLKAYASSEELNQECVDERFDLVTRETAPYVEWLGIQENPYGGGWAAGEGYGDKLRALLEELKEYQSF